MLRLAGLPERALAGGQSSDAGPNVLEGLLGDGRLSGLHPMWRLAVLSEGRAESLGRTGTKRSSRPICEGAGQR
jgi:hypothetical protein